MYAQADLRLCWSHIPHCWKSHALAHIKHDSVCKSVTEIKDHAKNFPNALVTPGAGGGMNSFQYIQIYEALLSKTRACDLGPTDPLFLYLPIYSWSYYV